MSQSIIYETNNKTSAINFAKGFFQNQKSVKAPNFIHIDNDKTSIADIKYVKNILKYKAEQNVRVILISIKKISNEAQNSALKILEENDSNTTIILHTSNCDILIETIKSRCLIIKGQNKKANLKDNQIKEFLVTMKLIDKMKFVRTIDNIEEFIEKIIYNMVLEYNNIVDIDKKILFIKDIQSAIIHNVSPKIILDDIALNI